MPPLKVKFSFKIVFLIIFEACLLVLRNKTDIDIFFFFFLLAAVLFCLDIVFLIINFLSARGIKISREVQEKITENEYLNIELSCLNKSFFPIINLEVGDFLACAGEKKQRRFLIEWIRPREKFKIKHGCICEQRGRYILGPTTISFFGFLGFFYIQRVQEAGKVIYVYPKTFNVVRTPSLTRGHLPWFGLETIFASGEEHEFFGLREYKKGDSLKRIHWFTVAKKNKLVVREFQRCSFYQVTIIFSLNKKENFGTGKESVSEYIIKTAASLTKYFIERNICTGVLAHAGRIVHFPFNKGEDYLEEIFKFYAEAKAESELTMVEFLQEYYQLIPPHSTLFILLTENNLEALVSVLHLKGYNVAVVAGIIMSSTFTSYPLPQEEIDASKKRILSRLSNVKIDVLFFSKGDNFEEVFAASKVG